MEGKVRWDSLDKGMELPPRTFLLSSAWVRQYVAAVEDGAIGELGAGAVSPMAVAALAIRSLLQSVELPAGAVHAGQELGFSRGVSTGQRLTSKARVVSSGQRGGWALVTFDQYVEDGEGRPVMSGRATVTAPVPEAIG